MKKFYTVKQLAKIIELPEEDIVRAFNKANLKEADHFKIWRNKLFLSELGACKLTLALDRKRQSYLNRFLDKLTEKMIVLTIPQLQRIILQAISNPALCKHIPGYVTAMVKP